MLLLTCLLACSSLHISSHAPPYMPPRMLFLACLLACSSLHASSYAPPCTSPRMLFLTCLLACSSLHVSSHALPCSSPPMLLFARLTPSQWGLINIWIIITAVILVYTILLKPQLPLAIRAAERCLKFLKGSARRGGPWLAQCPHLHCIHAPFSLPRLTQCTPSDIAWRALFSLVAALHCACCRRRRYAGGHRGRC
jgi:hypothetical protein